MLTSPSILSQFNPDLETIVETDASRLYGLGYALLQRDNNGNLRLIECNSRFLSETEGRYATCEIELLAIRYAFKKLHRFLAGLDTFRLISDHKPLIPILE